MTIESSWVFPLIAWWFSIVFVCLPEGKEPKLLVSGKNDETLVVSAAKMSNLVEFRWVDHQHMWYPQKSWKDSGFDSSINMGHSSCPHFSHHPTIRFHDRYMVFFMATILGDVQYSHFMRHLPTPDQRKTALKPSFVAPQATAARRVTKSDGRFKALPCLRSTWVPPPAVA